METAQELINYCQKNEVSIEVRGQILTLSKKFQAGSNQKFAETESICSVIYDLPSTRSGSIWGTTGDGIGGYAAIQSGLFKINSSKVAIRFLNSLKKFVGQN
jgi:hypothetical protein